MRNILGYLEIPTKLSIKGILRDFYSDALYKNSAFISMSRILNAGSGVIFWSLAARYYSIFDVGIATALIASIGLIIAISRLGFDVTMTRFMPLKDKGTVFSTCLIITSLSAVVVSFVYVMTVGFFSPSISFVKGYAIIFMALALLNATATTTGNAFISSRNARYYLGQNLIGVLRIPALIPLAVFGPMGIVGSLGLANVSVSLLAGIFIGKLMQVKFRLSSEFIRETYKFTTTSYVSDLLLNAPTYLMPLIFLNLLGAEDAARYYIASQIGAFILLIPEAIGSAFFVEASHGVNLKATSMKVLAVIYAILIPASIVVYMFGGLVLAFVGRNYTGSLDLVRIYAFSSFFTAIYIVFVPILNAKMMVNTYLKLNIVRFILVLVLSYIFILKMGLIGAGVAWIISQAILCLLIIGLVMKAKWTQIPRSEAA